jgi:[ribosomal protein S5]-alanine N-acetyltransferase
LILFSTERLDCVPLTPAAARRLVAADRAGAAALVGAELDPAWPLPDFADLLPLMAVAPEDAEWWGGLIVWREEGRVVGEIGTHAAPEAGEVEVGYSVVPAYRRRGIATEALGGLLAWIGPRGVRRAFGRTEAANVASRRTMEANGFRPEGGGATVRYRRDL